MTSRETEYLECERHWVFWLLMFVAGFYGVYTFLLRGGVFCNAQTILFCLPLNLETKAGTKRPITSSQ